MAKKTKKKKFFWSKIKSRQENLLSRRVHRTFKLTRRRDYHVKLQMPGYMAFTAEVFKTLKNNKNTFLLLILVGCILALWSASFMAQGRYLEIVALLRDTVQNTMGEPLTLMGETGSILVSIFFGGISGEDAANPYTILISLLIWLTTVWLIRNIVAGKKVTLRQGLYNSGAPIISSGLVVLVGAIQAVPAVLAVGIYAIANQSGLMDHGAVAMTASMGILAMVALSLYWLTSTFIALIIVTLPNMYPMRAVHLAGNLVSGIRLRILYRLLWLFVLLGFFWGIILGLSVSLDILFRSWFEWFMNVPFVPMVIMVLAVASMVFICSYIYLLYIKLVEVKHERIG